MSPSITHGYGNRLRRLSLSRFCGKEARRRYSKAAWLFRPGLNPYDTCQNCASKIGSNSSLIAPCTTRSLTVGTVTSNYTLAGSTFGIGRDNPPLSSPSRSSVCCAEDQEGLRHRDIEPAPCREGLVWSPTRMD